MKVTSKGQVTIPLVLRRKYGIDSRGEVDFVEEDGRIVVRVSRRGTSPVRALLGRGDVKLSTDQILSLTRRR